jgi:hypothetical protein
LSSFYQINSKLGVKVAYGLPLTWLIFGADRSWPSWVSLRVEICLPEGQILKSKVPYRVYLIWEVLMSAFQINKNFDVMTS